MNFLLEHGKDSKVSPTLREIEFGSGLNSMRAVQESLARLTRSGLIESKVGQARSIRVIASYPLAPEPESTLLLRFFSTTAHRFYPHVCHAAAMAPTPTAALGWLKLVSARQRSLAAIDSALERAEVHVNSEARALERTQVGEIWSMYEDFFSSLNTWVEWVALEECGAQIVLDKGFQSIGQRPTGTTETILEAQFDIATDTARYGRQEMARLAEAESPSSEEIEMARRNAIAFHTSLLPHLDRIWDQAASLHLPASAPDQLPHP